jgi:hypothetical protein
MSGRLEAKVAFITGAAIWQGRADAIRMAEGTADVDPKLKPSAQSSMRSWRSDHPPRMKRPGEPPDLTGRVTPVTGW